MMSQILAYFSTIQLLNIAFCMWTLINVVSEIYYRKRMKKSTRASFTRFYIISIWLIGSTLLMGFDITTINYLFIAITIYLWVYKYILTLMSAEEFDGEVSHLRLFLEKLPPVLEEYIMGSVKNIARSVLPKGKTNGDLKNQEEENISQEDIIDDNEVFEKNNT